MGVGVGFSCDLIRALLGVWLGWEGFFEVGGVAWAVGIETWTGGFGIEGGLLGVGVGHPCDLIWGLLGVWHGWGLVCWVGLGRDFLTPCFAFGLG